MRVASVQGKHEFCIAIFNRHLNSNSICPANHEVEYGHGWFYCDDDKPFQNPEWVAEAEQMMRSGSHTVYYWPYGNTYMLVANDQAP